MNTVSKCSQCGCVGLVSLPPGKCVCRQQIAELVKLVRHRRSYQAKGRRHQKTGHPHPGDCCPWVSRHVGIPTRQGTQPRQPYTGPQHGQNYDADQGNELPAHH